MDAVIRRHLFDNPICVSIFAARQIPGIRLSIEFSDPASLPSFLDNRLQPFKARLMNRLDSVLFLKAPELQPDIFRYPNGHIFCLVLFFQCCISPVNEMSAGKQDG